MTKLICRGYQCASTDLIDAHIFPRGFARDIMGDHTHNLKIMMDRVQTTQHGVYDPNILCESCDGKLGKLDDYALEICRRFPREHVIAPDGLFEMNTVDGDKFAKFVLSVLWRASITSRVEFRKVSLGPYEASAQKIIFGAAPVDSLPAYKLLLGRYQTRGGELNPDRNYTSPARLKIEGTNGWAFALHGFRVIAKIDRRPLPAVLGPAIVNGSTRLIGVFVPFHETPEGKAMWAMKKADLARLAQRKPR
jgi:hypothetical protein